MANLFIGSTSFFLVSFRIPKSAIHNRIGLLLRVLLLKTTATRFGSKILWIIEEVSFFWGDNDNYSCSAGWDLRSLKKKH